MLSPPGVKGEEASRPGGASVAGPHHPNVSFPTFQINCFSGLHHWPTQWEGIMIWPVMHIKT